MEIHERCLARALCFSCKESTLHPLLLLYPTSSPPPPFHPLFYLLASISWAIFSLQKDTPLSPPPPISLTSSIISCLKVNCKQYFQIFIWSKLPMLPWQPKWQFPSSWAGSDYSGRFLAIKTLFLHFSYLPILIIFSRFFSFLLHSCGCSLDDRLFKIC